MKIPPTIIHDWPPNIDAIRERFGKLPAGVLFCWGDYIYWPNGGGRTLPDHLIAHEMVHQSQQWEHPQGVTGWWEDYLTDDVFRLQQELEAHQAEWLVAQHELRDPNARSQHLNTMASRLASPMYGKMVTFSEAKKLIRQ